ncbi:hypothetical protein HY734_01825 [Candidatus Uhrbacteria bacterium]|nr:hypothetical protein [Candidatus Uhrbacteria bacterium]
MLEFLRPSFWFNVFPPFFSNGTLRVLFAFFALVLVSGIVLHMRNKRRKEGNRHKREAGARASRALLTMGGIGFLFLFFTYEDIRLLGARFWYLLWVVGAVIWAFFIARQAMRAVLEGDGAALVARREREKYLPTSNKRRR